MTNLQCPSCKKFGHVREHGKNAKRLACTLCWHSWPKVVEEVRRDRPPTFQQIIMEKMAAKKRELSNLEKMEQRERWRNFSEEKLKIRGGMAALRWCAKAYDEFSQEDMNELLGGLK